MPDTILDLTGAERRLLAYIYAKNGNRTKRLIRDAWETGIYDARLCTREDDEQMLQQLRNTRGPTWLNRLALTKL